MSTTGDQHAGQAAGEQPRYTESDVYDLGGVGPDLHDDVRESVHSGGIGAVPFSDHIKFTNSQQAGASISDNIGPRFGFAYSWGDKTVINGGVGAELDCVVYVVEVAVQQQRVVRGGEWDGRWFSGAELLQPARGLRDLVV